MAERTERTDFTTVTSDGTFQGYACVWDVPNSFNEIMRKGAFATALEQKGVRGIKMTWQHRFDEPVGAWLEIREDDTGLFVRGQLNLAVERGREAKALMETGGVNGLSISFDDANTAAEIGGETGLRTMTEVDLMEIAIVTFPSWKEAHVDHAISLNDAVELTGVKRTSDGYLTAFARVARTGIQVYKGKEIGRPDLEDVRVYRPETEVFHRDAMRSMTHRPLTNDHPGEPVSAANWKKYAIGLTGAEVVRDGEFIRVPLVLMDGVAIKDVESGKRQLSLGYVTDLKWGAGKTATGESFDAIQTGIRANHLAVVTAARGGPDLKIGDAIPPRREIVDAGDLFSWQQVRDLVDAINQRATQGDGPMSGSDGVKLKTITLDGLPCEMTDMSASVVQRAFGQVEARAKSFKEKLEAEEKEKKAAKDALAVAETSHKTAVDAKDAEIAALKKQVADGAVTPAKLMDMARGYADTIGRAKTIVGDALVTDGKTEAEIRRQVVDHHMGATAKGWTDDQVASSFAVITAKATQDGGGSYQPDRLADALSRPGPRQGDAQATLDAAYAERDKTLQNAWKNTKVA